MYQRRYVLVGDNLFDLLKWANIRNRQAFDEFGFEFSNYFTIFFHNVDITTVFHNC